MSEIANLFFTSQKLRELEKGFVYHTKTACKSAFKVQTLKEGPNKKKKKS